MAAWTGLVSTSISFDHHADRVHHYLVGAGGHPTAAARWGAFAMALPGTQGRALHAKGIDRKREALLEKRRATKETQLDVPLGGWPLESAEYIGAMKLVRESETRRLQVRHA